MPISTDLELLNRVLRELSGSFLQYVGECWPWTAVDADGEQLRSAINQCVDRQRNSIAAVADYLNPRQARVEFGKYSSEFTDLHYCSLKFLLAQLVKDQSHIVEALERQVTLLTSGDATRELVDWVLGNERENLAALKSLSAK